MINNELFMAIRHLKTFENLSSVQIAQRLNIPERTVRNWWNEDFYPVKMNRIKHKLINDKFKNDIEHMLLDCPTLTGVQIHRKLVAHGFQGSVDIVRRYLAVSRPKSRRTFLSLHFEPGEAVQLDFGDCGLLHYGDKRIRLCVCALVLCHSRLMYAELIPSEKLEYTLACIVNCFNYFGGVPQKIIVDNFKAAVSSHPKFGVATFNSNFLDFCNHYRILPVACNVRSPFEKGRIESGIGYIKGNFFNGSKFSSLEEVRFSLQEWLDKVANVRVHSTTREQPRKLFDTIEKEHLQPINPNPFDCARTLFRNVDSQCRINCDGNRYSVPEKFAYQTVVAKITADKVLIYHEDNLIAVHKRNYGHGLSVVDPDHQKLMLEERKTAAHQNLKANFLALGASAACMYSELTNKELNPIEHLKRIMVLVDMYGAEAVKDALKSAVDNQVYGADYVEHIIRLKKRPVENRLGVLHVTQGADNLKIQVPKANLEVYDIK